MWTDFVSGVKPSLAVSRANFEKEVQSYMESQPTLRALLTHTPAMCLVRVHLASAYVDGSEGRLEERLFVRVIHAPHDAIVFEKGEFYAQSFVPGLPVATREDIKDQPFIEHDNMALAFFITKADPDPLAENNTCILKVLDYVKLKDLTPTDNFVMDATFRMPPHRTMRLLR